MKVELVVPQSLDEITVGQLQKYMQLADDGIDTIPETLSLFCGIKKSQAMKLPRKVVEDALQSIILCLKEQPKEVIPRFSILDKDGEIEFGLIPSFDGGNLTFGEYVDIDTYFELKEVDAEFEYGYNNCHKLMAVLYRPITKEIKEGGLYQIEDYEGSSKYGELMKHAPASVLQSALLFFYTLNNELLTATRHYLEEVEALAKQVQNEKNYKKTTGGTEALTLLQDTMYLNTSKLLNFPYRKLSTHYHTWQMKRTSLTKKHAKNDSSIQRG